ncbi:unnamed protein product [Lactuca virosa]|uniref:Uncharacterized protein n=1 Tax=Lactuca virosa TaxID=75947 RepID=A0AAU9LNQ6_9ASTR|nr:unnamed protein product [Lactuca virosa]
MFGDVLFIDDDEDEPAGIGRICIKTKSMSKINGMVHVDIDGVKYIVSVSKIANWVLTIDHSKFQDGNESDGSSASNQFVSDDDLKEDQEECIRSKVVNMKNQEIERDYQVEGNAKDIASKDGSSGKQNENNEKWVDDKENENFVMEQVQPSGGINDDSPSLSKPSGFSKAIHNDSNSISAGVGGILGNYVPTISFFGNPKTKKGPKQTSKTGLQPDGTSLLNAKTRFIEGEWVFFKFKRFTVNFYALQEENKNVSGEEFFKVYGNDFTTGMQLQVWNQGCHSMWYLFLVSML